MTYYLMQGKLYFMRLPEEYSMQADNIRYLINDILPTILVLLLFDNLHYTKKQDFLMCITVKYIAHDNYKVGQNPNLKSILE